MRMRTVPDRSGASRRLRLGSMGLLLSGLVLVMAQPALAQVNPYNSVGLEWTAPGDDGNVGQVSSYQLRYSTTPVGTDTTGWWNDPTTVGITLGPPLAAAGATDSTRVSGLNQGTTYYFIIRALDEAQNISGFSNVATGTTYSCNAPGAAPAQFTAVADTGQVLVTWNSTSDPLAVSLHLYRAQGTSGSWTMVNIPLNQTSYWHSPLQPGTTYRYRAAWMGAACEGPSTATVSVTTPGTPPPPPPAAAEGSNIRAYPNPAHGSIRLVIDVQGASSQAVDVRVFDMSGRWIATVVNGSYPSGTSEVTWSRVARDGGHVGPGYYELLGTIGSTRVRERIVLLP